MVTMATIPEPRSVTAAREAKASEEPETLARRYGANHPSRLGTVRFSEPWRPFGLRLFNSGR